MSASVFLTGLAQAFSSMTLYEEGHPARERAVERAHERLLELQRDGEQLRFTFLGDEIVFNGRPLRELRSWDWGSRLAEAGIQRLECVGPVARGDFDVFLEFALGQLFEQPGSTAEVRQVRETNIRYGAVQIRGEETEEAGAEASDMITATLAYSFKEEAEAVEWIHEELKGGRNLQLLEAEAVVRSLSVAMHGDQQFVIPLLQLKRFDQYTTTHALNVSVLAMALAEFVGLSPTEIRTFGIAGLLHDLGKVAIPDDILNKPGKLTDQEREVMNGHTVEGARMILETEDNLDLAAIVAYEHHIRMNGGGYPEMRFARPCHQASNLVHVCDVFDALRTHRPYRDAWGHEKVLSYMEEGVGGEFDANLTSAFLKMMERWSSRIAVLESADQPLPFTGTEAGDTGAPPPTDLDGPAVVPL